MFFRLSKLSLRLAGMALVTGWIGLQSMASIAVAATLTPQQISQFLANPTAALTQYPTGGGPLVSYIRDLVMTDPATLNAVIGLLAGCNSANGCSLSAAQQAAIGTGLGQAAQAVVRTNPALAGRIQQALAASGATSAIAAYSAVTGNVLIGAAGGGGGGGGGGGPTGSGPTGGGGGGGGGTLGTAGVGTASFALSGGTVQGAAGSTSPQ